MVSPPLSAGSTGVKGYIASTLTSAVLLEVSIYGLAALDTHRPWRLYSA